MRKKRNSAIRDTRTPGLLRRLARLVRSWIEAFDAEDDACYLDDYDEDYDWRRRYGHLHQDIYSH